MSVSFSDFIEDAVVSNCCGSQVVFTDVCQSCQEHCEPVDEDEYYE